MASDISRGNLDSFSSYSRPRKEVICNSEGLSRLSLYDLHAGFCTDNTASTPESPSDPIFANTYQLPTGHDWLDWEKVPLLSEIDIFPNVEYFRNPIISHLAVSPAVNPVELTNSMAGTATYGQDGLEEATQLFESSELKQEPAQAPLPKQKSAKDHSRSPSTPRTSENLRYHSRKRKSSGSGSAELSSRSSVSPDLESGNASSSSTGKRRSIPKMPPKKTAHNMIEKRYRINLNDKIAALRDCVPSLRVMVHRLEQQSFEDGNEEMEEEEEQEDLSGLAPAHKLNKATVLSKATEYIAHLERKNKNLAKENAALRNRMEGFEMLLKGTDGYEKAQEW